MNPEKHKTMLMTTLILGVLMAALDIAILGPALPAIRGTLLGIDERALSYLYSVYILFNLIGTPLMAKLSDVVGRRVIYVIDLVLFSAGSLIVAISQDFTWLLIGRAVQGFGAGGVLPVANAVIGDIFPPEKRGSALGLVGITFGMAFLIGPILAGIILSFASWHWLFIINIPIALVLIFPAWSILPHVHHKKTGRFDLPGILLLSLMLTGLTLGITQIDSTRILESLGSWNVWPWFLTALISLGFLIPVEARAEHPILPKEVFTTRQLRVTYMLSAGAGLFQASLVFLPLLAIAHQAGLTPSQSGYLLIPLVLALTIMNPLVGNLLDKVGAKPLLLGGLIILGISLVAVALTASDFTAFILTTSLAGAGLAVLLGPPLRYIILEETPAAHRTLAQGVLNISSSLGTMVGGALLGGVTASFGGGDEGYTMAFLVTSAVAIPMIAAVLMLKNKKKIPGAGV